MYAWGGSRGIKGIIDLKPYPLHCIGYSLDIQYIDIYIYIFEYTFNSNSMQNIHTGKEELDNEG